MTTSNEEVNEMTKKPVHATDLEDATIVAFLSLKNHKITPHKRIDGRMFFRVEGDISSSLQSLYCNEKIGVLDFIKSFKSTKSCIFSLK